MSGFEFNNTHVVGSAQDDVEIPTLNPCREGVPPGRHPVRESRAQGRLKVGPDHGADTGSDQLRGAYPQHVRGVLTGLQDLQALGVDHQQGAVWLNRAGQVDRFTCALRESDFLVQRVDQWPSGRHRGTCERASDNWRANTAKVDEAPATTASLSPPCASKRRNAQRTAGHW